MELSWSTFLLEIFNFLVLVWILQHFLYRPVRDVIARRQQAIEDRIADAKATQTKAEEMQQQYESRLDDWRHEQQQARDTLESELQEERQRREKALRADLREEQKKLEHLQQQQNLEMQRQLESRALKQGGEFASRILSMSAGPELESRFSQLLLDGLGNLSAAQAKALRSEIGVADATVEVASAYPLGQDQRNTIKQALEELLQRPVSPDFVQAPELLAGFRINLGAWELGANLRDELRGFARLAVASPGAEHE